jgi:hypothetical protein
MGPGVVYLTGLELGIWGRGICYATEGREPRRRDQADESSQDNARIIEVIDRMDVELIGRWAMMVMVAV